MRQIFVLEEQTVNKIAAGEVIERPASVVKELVENSIDAGSRHVVIEAGNGGQDYIRVTDDGSGISEEDVELAFEKHATSKIRSIEDLSRSQTLGFRGEALPSIAAVSRVELSTRYKDEDFGTYVKLEGGVIKDRRRITRVVGTTVEVKSLFYNLPARIGTIKSKATELRHIVEVCSTYAISYPEIKFELLHDGLRIFSTLGNGRMLDAIVTTYGRSVANGLIELSSDGAPGALDARIRGYISRPSVSYGTKRYLLTFVNRRFVKSELIEKAVKRGYASLLPKHAYPFAVISLSIDPREINVNIHPTKREIRFHHADELFQSIAEAVLRTLRDADLIPEVVAHEDRLDAADFSRTSLPSVGKSSSRVSLQTSFQVDERAERAATGTGNVSGLTIRFAPLYQVLDSYIIAQSEEDDVLIIDQHAAAERIMYERLVASFGGRIEKQQLLRPLMPQFSPQQLYMLREHEELLRSMGFDIERLDEESYVIRAIPVVFHGMLAEDELTEVLMRLVEESGREEERIKVLLSTAACKASIKAGEKLSYESMRDLVEQLKAVKIPYACPHGRPTMIRLSKKEIEKRFKRR